MPSAAADDKLPGLGATSAPRVVRGRRGESHADRRFPGAYVEGQFTGPSPWTPGLEPQLPEPLSIEALIDQMASAGVDRVVIVPPHWEGLRNDYATEALDRTPIDFASWAASISSGRMPGAIAELMKQRGNLGMRQSFLSTREREQLVAGACSLAVGRCRTIRHTGDDPCTICSSARKDRDTPSTAEADPRSHGFSTVISRNLRL